MSATTHREKLVEKLENNSITIVYSGILLHTNEDEYYNPFEVNSQFFYLTGLERAGMCLIISKINGLVSEILFIEEADKTVERWTGKMPTKEEVSALSGIEDVRYVEEINSLTDWFINRNGIDKVYFDTFRNSYEDIEDYNLKKAREFGKRYPGIMILDLHREICSIRRIKDQDEIQCMRKAIDITRQGLNEAMKSIKPGQKEYQVQAAFEYRCKMLGAKKWAFPTIAGSGINGCMMHYETNDATIEDGSLILMDVGAKYNNYCSDITRTFPANGKFTDRQKEFYELVLSANKAVAEYAMPGVTLKQLQLLTRKILGEGLVKLGKIKDPEEVGKYYMHGVSHLIGIDAHDINFGSDCLEEGFVISDEPGLYIDEEQIGIRIEDDLLITKNGCEVLSKDIIKEIADIEEYMAGK